MYICVLCALNRIVNWPNKKKVPTLCNVAEAKTRYARHSFVIIIFIPFLACTCIMAHGVAVSCSRWCVCVNKWMNECGRTEIQKHRTSNADEQKRNDTPMDLHHCNCHAMLNAAYFWIYWYAEDLFCFLFSSSFGRLQQWWQWRKCTSVSTKKKNQFSSLFGSRRCIWVSSEKSVLSSKMHRTPECSSAKVIKYKLSTPHIHIRMKWGTISLSSSCRVLRVRSRERNSEWKGLCIWMPKPLIDRGSTSVEHRITSKFH